MRAVATPSKLRRAVTHLRRGGLLIYPTETAYAIGCDATNPAAVRAIFRLKGRERSKPLPIIVASRAMAERYAWLTPLARRLARAHWPGPLTIVVERRKSPAGSRHSSTSMLTTRGMESVGGSGILARGASARDGSIAVRTSSHDTARSLARRLGRPIVSTSANHSGSPTCTSARAAVRSLDFSGRGSGERPDEYPFGQRRARRGVRHLLVLDAGSIPRRRPSTIVDARGGHPIVLRRGSVRIFDSED